MVLEESERLAEALRELVIHGRGIEHLQPFTTRRSGHL
jgi:hypothetical protein